jgi:hypothetical protein
MENSLDQYFVTFKIFKDGTQVHEMVCPKSLIHEMTMKWKYPGSVYDFHIVDHTGNFRMDSKLLNDFFS